MIPEPLWLVFGLGLLFRLFTSRGQHGTGVGEEVGWESQGPGGSWIQGRCGQDPSDASSLGLVRLFSGAITLCIHLAGVMKGSPGRANPGRGPGRQAAGLWIGRGRVDQAWNLGQPEGGKKPRGQLDASCLETRTSMFTLAFG